MREAAGEDARAPSVTLHARDLARRLRVLESVAVIPRVSSTNLIARRVVHECIDNQLSLPRAIVIAGEQFAGMGRNARTWSSPAGKGIYATTLLTVSATELPVVPLQIGNIVASYLRDGFGIDARIKWPNDIIVARRKIAGILIEARAIDDRAFVLIGTGINVESRDDAIAMRDVAPNRFDNIDEATAAFVVHLDKRLAEGFNRHRALAEWNQLAIHEIGDRIECQLGERKVAGSWAGLDEHGRALLRDGDETIAISAGDLILT